MGTDVHGVVQRRYNGRNKPGTPPDKQWQTVAEIERGRNYLFFAILADVRNGFAFAGVETHEPVEPIQSERGFPEGFVVCDNGEHAWNCRSECKTWMGDHSFGWVTLEEVEQWPGWDNPMGDCGVISLEQYEAWKVERKRPASWSGMIAGPGIVVAEEMAVGVVPHGATHVKVRWGETPRAAIGKLVPAWLQYVRLKWGGTDHGGVPIYDVRLVFGFDS